MYELIFDIILGSFSKRKHGYKHCQAPYYEIRGQVNVHRADTQLGCCNTKNWMNSPFAYISTEA